MVQQDNYRYKCFMTFPTIHFFKPRLIPKKQGSRSLTLTPSRDLSRPSAFGLESVGGSQSRGSWVKGSVPGSQGAQHVVSFREQGFIHGLPEEQECGSLLQSNNAHRQCTANAQASH